jgi:hypothetical protein
VQPQVTAVARLGDTIAIESPTYFGLLHVLEALGLRRSFSIMPPCSSRLVAQIEIPPATGAIEPAVFTLVDPPLLGHGKAFE